MMTVDKPGLVRLRDSNLRLADPTADDVVGLTTVDPEGHRLGEVDDLVIDETHRRARLLVVGSGGLLGLGRFERLIPVEMVTRVDSRVHVDRVHDAIPAERVADTPDTPGERPYDPELVESPPYADLYATYGLTPFWGVDYITPYFHRR
jgi:sporulation protein YlmC with PRC-barrel domain